MNNKESSPWTNKPLQKPDGWGQTSPNSAWSSPSTNAKPTPLQSTSQNGTSEKSPSKQSLPQETPQDPSPQKVCQISTTDPPLKQKKQRNATTLLLVLVAFLLGILCSVLFLKSLQKETESSPVDTITSTPQPSVSTTEIAPPSEETSAAIAETTAPAVPLILLNPNDYMGRWEPSGGNYSNIYIFTITEDSIVFDLTFIRLAYFESVSASFSEKQAFFSIQNGDYTIKGSFEFFEDSILLSILESNYPYLSTMQITYFLCNPTSNPTAFPKEPPYPVQLDSSTEIFSDPTPSGRFVGYVEKSGLYTIIEHTFDQFGTYWGKLKSGNGWVILD